MKTESLSRFWGWCAVACLGSALLLCVAALAVADPGRAVLGACSGALGVGFLWLRLRPTALHRATRTASGRAAPLTAVAAMCGAALWIVLREPLGIWTTALPLALFAALFALLLISARPYDGGDP